MSASNTVTKRVNRDITSEHQRCCGCVWGSHFAPFPNFFSAISVPEAVAVCLCQAQQSHRVCNRDMATESIRDVAVSEPRIRHRFEIFSLIHLLHESVSVWQWQSQIQSCGGCYRDITSESLSRWLCLNPDLDIVLKILLSFSCSMNQCRYGSGSLKCSHMEAVTGI